MIASDGESSDVLGSAVAIEGATIAVGAPQDDPVGSVRLFARSGAALRTETATLSSTDLAPDAYLGGSVAISGETIIAGAELDTIAGNNAQGSAITFFAPAPVPGPGPGPAPGPVSPPIGPPLTTQPPFPAKLEILRARVLSATRRLDVFAPITARASGRVKVSFQAAGRTTTFTAPVDSARARVRFSHPISARQARLGTGILTLSYPGDPDTQPQVVRLRAAARPAALQAGRPTIIAGRLRASGRISSRARGVARIQVLFEPAGRETVALQYNARIARGRYTLNQALPAGVLAQIAGRRGVVHSYTLFTGYQAAGMRGEMASYQILGGG